jgi:hypothetical protein
MSASEDTNSGRAPAMPSAGQGGDAVGREPEAVATPPGATERPAADPRVGPSSKDETRAKGRANGEDEDEDEWRHEPVAPLDERNPLKSLGRAVADVATGGSPDASQPRDR